MLRRAVGQILPLVEACLAVAGNPVGRGAPVRPDIANEAVAARIDAVVAGREGQALRPLERRHLLLNVELVDSFNDSIGSLNSGDLRQPVTRVIVVAGEVVESLLQLGYEAFRVLSQLILFIEYLTIESRL